MNTKLLDQAIKTLESVRGALGSFAKADVDLTLGMLRQEKETAQPEQEPVGFTIQSEIDYAKSNPKEYAGFWANKDDDDEDWIALYTTPPQRTWVGLTKAQCGVLWKTNMTPFEYYQAIEDKLKEKNT